MTNNHKTLLKVSIIGGVALSGLFGWLGYQDFKAREAALEQVTLKRAEIDKADAQIREIPKLEEKIIVLRETVNEYVRILPDDKEINLFVEKLTEFAARSDVHVKKLDDQDVRARSGRNQKGAAAAFDRVVYKLSVAGTCEQLLTFMDLFENHERFVKISSFRIEHQDSTQPDVDPMSIPHQIDLDLETYVYNAKVQSKESVVIPQETHKLERLKAAGLVGGDAASDLVLASYRHEPGLSRRDLFYDPRIIDAKKLQATEQQRATQVEALEELIARLRRIASDVAAEEKIENTVKRLQAREKVNQDLLAMGSDINKAKADSTFTVEEIRNRFVREVEEPFTRMLENRDLSLAAAPMIDQQIEERVAKMRVAMGESRWDEVVSLHDEITRLSSAASGADIKALVKDAEGMQRVAKAHLDFNARPISFGGAVCFQNDPAHAVVIINGRSYSPGESVDQDLVVKTISPSTITFEFRGVSLTQPMKMAAPQTTPSGSGRSGGASAPRPNAPKKTRS